MRRERLRNPIADFTVTDVDEQHVVDRQIVNIIVAKVSWVSI
jgi:hypothetical protein